MSVDLDALLRRADEFHESVEPVDVPIVLGGEQVTVRVPYLKPEVFGPLADRYSPGIWYRDSSGAWFDVPGVTREHPGVVLLDGDETDDLTVTREGESVYRWGEVYDAVSGEDRQKLHAAVWGLYVWAPQQVTGGDD